MASIAQDRSIPCLLMPLLFRRKAMMRTVVMMVSAQTARPDAHAISHYLAVIFKLHTGNRKMVHDLTVFATNCPENPLSVSMYLANESDAA